MKNPRYKILLVDSNDIIQQAFISYINDSKLAWEVFIAGSIATAKNMLSATEMNIVISNYSLPDGNVFDILEFEKDIPVIVTTETGNEEVAVQLIKAGASEYIIKDKEYNYFKLFPTLIKNAIRSKFSEVQIRDFHYKLKEMVDTRTEEFNKLNLFLQEEIEDHKKTVKVLKESLNKQKSLLLSLLKVVSSIIGIADKFTAEHQLRVARLARAIALEMNLPEEKIEGLYRTSFVHDIGKINIPSQIINKPEALTTDEYKLVKTHPFIGFEILKDIDFPWPVAKIILQHHERLDGSGYPYKIKEAEILLEAKIIAVADVVEAMCSNRPWRPALGPLEALTEIMKYKGKYYDPEIVDICVMLFSDKDFKFDDEPES
ncbi:HD domain-containing protein [Candidatus Dependentiae bacterium]|nr:HD domain-containing protein [Candidatus Dependentiae bacterium]